jgi:hypothetical protein
MTASTKQMRPCMPQRTAVSRALPSMAGVKSTPTTNPRGPTIRAAITVSCPGPHPRSTTVPPIGGGARRRGHPPPLAVEKSTPCMAASERAWAVSRSRGHYAVLRMTAVVQSCPSAAIKLACTDAPKDGLCERSTTCAAVDTELPRRSRRAYCEAMILVHACDACCGSWAGARTSAQS